jgi:hypothetical protein
MDKLPSYAPQEYGGRKVESSKEVSETSGDVRNRWEVRDCQNRL